MKRIGFAIVRLLISLAALAFVYLPLRTFTIHINGLDGVTAQNITRSVMNLLQDTAVAAVAWVLPLALGAAALLSLLSVPPVLGKVFNLIGKIVFSAAMLLFLIALGMTMFTVFHF